MTRDEVLNSISLKKRFAKDCNLPIAIFDNPYFYERLSSLDFLENSLDKFDVFCQELEPYTCEQDYFEQYNLIKDSIIIDLKENTQFKILSLTQLDFKSEYSRRNVYVENNDGFLFVSLDMPLDNNYCIISPITSKVRNHGFDGTGEYCQNVSTINKREITAQNSEIYHQVVKHYFGEEITENDLVFYHNGALAKFLEPIPDPWSEL